MTDCVSTPHKLLITIVEKGLGSSVVEVTKEAGCHGGTIVPGKGTRRESSRSFFGFTFDPEKDIIISLVHRDMAQQVLDEITKAVQLDKPGTGIAFVLDVGTTTGIAHLLNQLEQ